MRIYAGLLVKPRIQGPYFKNPKASRLKQPKPVSNWNLSHVGFINLESRHRLEAVGKQRRKTVPCAPIFYCAIYLEICGTKILRILLCSSTWNKFLKISFFVPSPGTNFKKFLFLFRRSEQIFRYLFFCSQAERGLID